MTACKNCGTELKGKYCYNCGQKKILPEDKKLGHLVGEFFHGFTHLDGKYLKALKNILLRPGKITRDITDGITAPHFKLSSLFLVGTIIYYLLPNHLTAISTSINLSYKKQVEQSEDYRWKNKISEEKSIKENIPQEALEKRYDQRQHDYGKLLTLILIPLLIPVLWIINLLIKKFKKNYSFTAYDLGIASLEINSIILYGLLIIAGIVSYFLSTIISSETIVMTGIIIFILAVFALLLLFFKRAYQIKWWQASVCLIIFLFGYVIVISLYGTISFLIFI